MLPWAMLCHHLAEQFQMEQVRKNINVLQKSITEKKKVCGYSLVAAAAAVKAAAAGRARVRKYCPVPLREAQARTRCTAG